MSSASKCVGTGPSDVFPTGIPFPLKLSMEEFSDCFVVTGWQVNKGRREIKIQYGESIEPDIHSADYTGGPYSSYDPINYRKCPPVCFKKGSSEQEDGVNRFTSTDPITKF